MHDFWETVATVAIASGVAHVSCALEISCENADSRRVHFHLFGSLKNASEAVDVLEQQNTLLFQGRRAGHCVGCMPGSGRGARARAVGQGHYYLQCLKIGVVLAKTNWLKNKDWHVRQSWVLDLWRLRKLTHESARRELIACRDKAHQGLREVDALEAAEYSQRVLDELAQTTLTDQQLRFDPPSALERGWLAQYEAKPSGHRLRRYKFLIYEGVSRSGKTERAIQWFTREKTLVVSSMNTSTPSLRPWLSGKFKAIVFDEGNWSLVALNRQLFQAGMNSVTLSQSQWNEHAYQLCLLGVPLMVTSNNFWQDCDDAEARDWILANSYFISLNAKKWDEA
jgi:hypothetical protein